MRVVPGLVMGGRKESKNESKRGRFDSFLTLFGVFSDFLATRSPEKGEGTLFLFFVTLGPEGPRKALWLVCVFSSL